MVVTTRRLDGGITPHCNGPAGRNGPCDSQRGSAPGRPVNVCPLCRRMNANRPVLGWAPVLFLLVWWCAAAIVPYAVSYVLSYGRQRLAKVIIRIGCLSAFV